MSQITKQSDVKLDREHRSSRSKSIAGSRTFRWEIDPPTEAAAGAKSKGIHWGPKLLGRFNGLSHGRIQLLDRGELHELGDDIQGKNQWLSAAILVSDPAFYRRIAVGGVQGSAESYIDGQWSCSDLTQLIRIMIRNIEHVSAMNSAVSWMRQRVLKIRHALRANSIRGSKKNIVEHYDLGNDFYRLFLDATMNYSSGIFDSDTARRDFPDVSDPLQAASLVKMDRICKKLNLQPGHEVLEIGTGWGAMAIHMASRYGCQVTTTTISEEQFRYANQQVEAAGLQDQIKVIKDDYRELEGSFDKVVSVEMVEAVGYKYMNGFFKACCDRLKPDGEMLLQAITIGEQNWKQYIRSVDFIRTHVFPGGCLPSVGSLQRAAGQATDMRMLHLDDMTPHYALTLNHWKQRFLSKLDHVRDQGYDDRLIRLWNFYLSYCEAAFEERRVNCVQVVFGRPSSQTDAAVW